MNWLNEQMPFSSKFCSGSFQQVHEKGNEHFYWTSSYSAFNVNCYYSAILLLLYQQVFWGPGLFSLSSAAKGNVAALRSSFTQRRRCKRRRRHVWLSSNEGWSLSLLSLRILVLIVLKFTLRIGKRRIFIKLWTIESFCNFYRNSPEAQRKKKISVHHLRQKNCGKMISSFKREDPCAMLASFHKMASFIWEYPLLHRVHL